MKPIPIVDLQKQYANIKSEIDNVIVRILEKGSYILDEEVLAFERDFAKFCNVTHAFGVASGTDALQLALEACGTTAGTEVITSCHTATATIVAIERTGARAILVDIEPNRFTLNPELVARVITENTRAILPVHMYGCPANLEALLQIAKKNNLYVVEDCAQAHGALFQGKPVGSFGNLSAFSFYPTKNIGAIGDGGAILTNNPELAEKINLLRQYGWKDRYISTIKGTNSRLDEIQAGILRVKLHHLKKWNLRRRNIANLYNELLSTTEELSLPVEPPNCQHVYHQYVIRTSRRDKLKEYLKEHGIASLIHYPIPIHMQPAYQNLGYVDGDFPSTEQACREILSLPIYPEMADVSVRHVCKTIRAFFTNPATQ